MTEGADRRIIAVLEPRSHAMRAETHQQTPARAADAADQAFRFRPAALSWDMERSLHSERAAVCEAAAEIVRRAPAMAHNGDCAALMSNGGFEDIHRRLRDALEEPDGDA